MLSALKYQLRLNSLVAEMTRTQLIPMKKNCLYFVKFFCIPLTLFVWSTACTPSQDGTSTETSEAGTEEASEEVASPPRTATGSVGGVEVSIAYASPGVKGRTVWGDLIPYDQVWRTGANAATIFETSGDVLIQGQSLPAGKYSLFTIPSASGTWTVIFNKTWDQWGAYNYDEAEDALRVEARVIPLEDSVERLRFEVDGDAGKVVLAWEELMLTFDIAAA